MLILFFKYFFYFILIIQKRKCIHILESAFKTKTKLYFYLIIQQIDTTKLTPPPPLTKSHCNSTNIYFLIIPLYHHPNPTTLHLYALFNFWLCCFESLSQFCLWYTPPTSAHPLLWSQSWVAIYFQKHRPKIRVALRCHHWHHIPLIPRVTFRLGKNSSCTLGPIV